MKNSIEIFKLYLSACLCAFKNKGAGFGQSSSLWGKGLNVCITFQIVQLSLFFQRDEYTV